MVASVFLIIYLFVGHGFTEFYFGGKTEMLEVAGRVNKLCNDSGSCPATLEGWQARGSKTMPLFNGNMRYFAMAEENSSHGAKRKEFRLVYSFFMPDDWFEVEGGVGKPISSGWKSR
jgi:hypothetical protein